MSGQAPILILFDLVSTITDAGPRYAQAYLDIASQYNLKIPTRRDILNELGQRTLKEIISIHSPDLPQDKIPVFMNDCNSACDSMLEAQGWVEELYPHVRESLTSLMSQGYTLGLYTGTRQEAASDQLRYHDLERIFPANLVRAKDNVADDGKNSQTIKKEQIASIIRDNPGSRIIVIGDSISDYHAARDNGASFIGFANTQKNIFRFAQAGVTTVFTAYERLPGLMAVMTADDTPPLGYKSAGIPLRGFARP